MKHAEAEMEQKRSLTPCPSLLSFFSRRSLHLLVFGGLFLALSGMGAMKERIFLPAFLALGLLLFKFENARNFLAGKTRVHRKSLGRPVPGLSLSVSLSAVPASCQCHPLSPLPEHSLPIFCLTTAS